MPSALRPGHGLSVDDCRKLLAECALSPEMVCLTSFVALSYDVVSQIIYEQALPQRCGDLS
jgi:hypothetical protein